MSNRFPNYSTPKALNELLGAKFDVAKMGPGFKRGMVLKVYRAKIKQLPGTEAFTGDLKYATLLPKDGDGYDHPRLIINFAAGSAWIPELHAQHYPLKELINERLECDFLSDIKIQ